jgi:lactate permease
LLHFIAALIPIVWLILSLGVFKMPAHRACSVALVATGALAVFFYKMPIVHMATAAAEGAVVALWPILIVILAAIFTYNLSLETGAMETIKTMLTSISDDKRVQVLILAWGFGGFLEAVAGYGTAVAIPAGILLALGVEPVLAAVLCLVANTAPTAFGSVGIPVLTLANVTGLDEATLAFFVSLQLFVLIIVLPFVLVWMISGSIKNIKGVFWITLASGLSFALSQLIISKYLGSQLPALVGSICSMLVTILAAKRKSIAKSPVTIKEGLKAWSSYILTFALVLLASPVFPAASRILGALKWDVTIYSGENPVTLSIKWLSGAGVLMIIAAVVGGKIQGAAFGKIISVFAKTAKQLKNSFITVISIVAMAKIMGYGGMVEALANGLVAATGGYFVFLSPLIGALGTFLTGSDTSSNVLFGPLQNQVASAINVSPYWLAAANTSGATAGKMISPQSIAVVTSATSLVGLEGKIFAKALWFCLLYILILGVLVFVFKFA